MRAALRRACVAMLITSALSCSEPRKPPPAEQAALGGNVAARVADDAIPVSLVADVAKAQHVSADAALRRLVDDAVAAHAARSRGLDADVPGSWNLRAARARFAVEHMLDEARAKGPPTDDEIKRISDMHWQEVDRPPSARTVHVVAIVDPKDPPEKRARARAVAEQLHAAVESARDAEDFLARAKAVPHPADLKVQAEALPAVTEDGWISEGNGQMDARFSKAANALGAPGATSGIVESDFGFHVIRLVERIPERRMPLEARRIAFVDEAFSLRAQDLKRAKIDELRAAHRIVIEPAADERMRAVSTATKESGRAP